LDVGVGGSADDDQQCTDDGWCRESLTSGGFTAYTARSIEGRRRAMRLTDGKEGDHERDDVDVSKLRI
jgi:hypothetical protein